MLLENWRKPLIENRKPGVRWRKDFECREAWNNHPQIFRHKVESQSSILKNSRLKAAPTWPISAKMRQNDKSHFLKNVCKDLCLGAVSFIPLSLHKLPEGLQRQGINWRQSCFSSPLCPRFRESKMTLNNDRFAVCSVLQFTEHVLLLYLICSLLQPSEVHRMSIGIFILQMSKLKPREVIIPKWNCPLTPNSVLLLLSCSITLRIKSLLFIQPCRYLGYLNWEFSVIRLSVLAEKMRQKQGSEAGWHLPCLFVAVNSTLFFSGGWISLNMLKTVNWLSLSLVMVLNKANS